MTVCLGVDLFKFTLLISVAFQSVGSWPQFQEIFSAFLDSPHFRCSYSLIIRIYYVFSKNAFLFFGFFSSVSLGDLINFIFNLFYESFSFLYYTCNFWALFVIFHFILCLCFLWMQYLVEGKVYNRIWYSGIRLGKDGWQPSLEKSEDLKHYNTFYENTRNNIESDFLLLKVASGLCLFNAVE